MRDAKYQRGFSIALIPHLLCLLMNTTYSTVTQLHKQGKGGSKEEEELNFTNKYLNVERSQGGRREERVFNYNTEDEGKRRAVL